MHKETVKIVPGGDTAVLFIHGIVGTPEHFRKLIPLEQMVPESWSIYNLLLPGHGASVKDFGRSSMKQWREYAYCAFDSLAQSHEHVYVVGHSMGTLFALQLALAYPQKIPALFLLAVPLRPFVGLQSMNDCLRLVFGRIREDKPMESAIAMACGSTPTRKLWRYLSWIPRFAELFLEIWMTEKQLPQIATNCIVFQSDKDELVARGSTRVLLRSGLTGVNNLPDSGHFYYAPQDKKCVCDAFAELIKKKA